MSQKFDVKFGDIWKIGKHRLLCGDSTEKSIIEAFLQKYTPKLCVTDPPYGVNYTSRCTNEDLYKLKVKNDHIVSWGDAFRLSEAPVLYVWFSSLHCDVVLRALRDAGYDPKQMIVWVKNSFSLRRHMYHVKHEQCLVSIKNGQKSTELWTGDRKQISVWKIDSVKPKERFHPTEKPMGVYEIPIHNHTKKGDRVLDLFAGSGTIFASCEKTKRIGLGVELDPSQCSRILERMNKLGCEVSFEASLFEKPHKS